MLRDNIITCPQDLSAWSQAIYRCASPLPGSVPYENCRPVSVSKIYDHWKVGNFLSARFPHVDSAAWRRRCELGRIRQKNRAVSALDTVRAGNVLQHFIPDTIEPDVSNKVSILYEDSHIVVLDKPAPLPVHPCGRFNKNTLISFLRRSRPHLGLFIVHRLDAETTGVMIIAKSKSAANDLRRQFDQRSIHKTYLSRVNNIPDNGKFDCSAALSCGISISGKRRLCINGMPSETCFELIKTFPDKTALLKVFPKTGRTNQIRLHLQSLGHPIVGDGIYGAGKRFNKSGGESRKGLCLHAGSVKFRHPYTGDAMEFFADNPSWTIS